MKKRIHKPHRIKKKKPIFKKPLFWVAILILILLGTAIYFLVFFDKFQVKKVIISGNEKVRTEDLQELVSQKIERNFLVVISRSIFLISPNKINKAIQEEYPDIDSVKIRRELPDTLNVNVIERKPFAIFCVGSNCYLIDEKGVTFEKTSSGEDSFPIVRHFENKEVVLGKEAVKKEIMEKIVKIKKGTEDRSQITIKEANIVSGERLNIKTSEGWQVYFNLTADIDLQVEKLNLLLEKEISKENRAELQYIDLRFGNKAYYK